MLCIDRNSDVVTCVRETLRRAGCDVHTSNNLRDALILMRVSRFDLLVVGTDLSASPATEKTFRDACTTIPIVELGSDFPTVEAGEAASGLLAKIAAKLESPS
ncbi:MAG TPA: hypothetical protein VE377_11245 [Candidatus Dormibacteraeota bacterium]|nr:hypothetical protein [Candidatus Dormibacteraeota bacterium]